MSLRRRRTTTSSSSSSYGAVVGWLGKVGSTRKGLVGVVSLDEVLSGATCSPISLKDFEAFLTHQEFSVENLQFVTWLADYTSRFALLSPYLQSQALPTLPLSPALPSLNRPHVPAPPALARSDSADSLCSSATLQTPDRKFSKLPVAFEWMDKSPTRTGSVSGRGGGAGDAQEQLQEELEDEEGIWVGQTKASTFQIAPFLTSPTSPSPATSPISPWETTDPFSSLASPISPGGSQTVSLPSRFPIPRHFPLPPLPSAGSSAPSSRRPSRQREGSTTSSMRPFLLRSTSLLPPTKTDEDLRDEMRLECERVWATFFLEGAAKELNVEEGVKTALEKGLEAGGWHPDLFAKAHRASRTMLITHSLPSFLSRAGININRPKQLFWYYVGTVDLLLSLLIFLLCLFLAPTSSSSRPIAWRAVRLIGVLFASFGAMQTYAAHLGICTQVQGRGARQLHAWELEETAAMVEARDEEEVVGMGTVKMEVMGVDVEGGKGTLEEPPTSTTELVFDHVHGAGGGGRRRPPIFGPEMVISDPKVLELQRKMVRDILVVGGVWAGVGVALVMSVPGLG